MNRPDRCISGPCAFRKSALVHLTQRPCRRKTRFIPLKSECRMQSRLLARTVEWQNQRTSCSALVVVAARLIWAKVAGNRDVLLLMPADNVFTVTPRGKSVTQLDLFSQSPPAWEQATDNRMIITSNPYWRGRECFSAGCAASGY